VQLLFAHPLGSVAIDPIVLTSVSCEFADFSCQSAQHRDVISGFASSEVVINLPHIPEPGALPLALTGLLGIAAISRVWPMASAPAPRRGLPRPRS
jgi:hypothetical protein